MAQKQQLEGETKLLRTENEEPEAKKNSPLKTISHCHVAVPPQSAHLPHPNKPRACICVLSLPPRELGAAGNLQGRSGESNLLLTGINISSKYSDSPHPPFTPPKPESRSHIFVFWSFLLLLVPLLLGLKNTGIVKNGPSGALSPLHVIMEVYTW